MRGVHIDRSGAERLPFSKALDRYLSEVSSTKRASAAYSEGQKSKAGTVKIMPEALAALAGQALASIEKDAVIEKILALIEAKVTRPEAAMLPPPRAPPQLEIDDDWLWDRPNLASLFATSRVVWRSCLCLCSGDITSVQAVRAVD
ncbi:MAG: hypothetical protein AAGI72_01170 [Pseudomonadota bacterium]